MGCFLTVTRSDFEQLEKVLGNKISYHGYVAKNIHRVSVDKSDFIVANKYSVQNSTKSESQNNFNAAVNGTLLHGAYEYKVLEEFGNSDREVSVVLKDGRSGRIDSIINDKYLVDYKNHDMRTWSESQAKHYVKKFSSQMKDYVECDYTPKGSEPIIVATCPPNDENIRSLIQEGLKREGVEIVFCGSAEIDAVVNTLKEIIPEDHV